MRFIAAEMGHVVNLLPPISTAGGKVTDVFSMKNYSHATIIVQAGVTDADAGNVLVEACDDATPTTHTEIAFNAYKCETDSADVLGARTAVAATGIDVSGNDNTVYVIELDAAELPAGKPNVRLTFSAPGGANLMSAVAILSGARYAGPQSASELP